MRSKLASFVVNSLFLGVASPVGAQLAPGDGPLVGRLATPNAPEGIAIVDNHAMIADHDALVVVDVADAAHPCMLARAPIENYCSSLAASPTRVVVGCSDAAVVFDASSARRIATLQAPRLRHLAIDGARLVIATDADLEVYDLGQLASPPRRVAVQFADSIALAGNMAWASTAPNGTIVGVDLSASTPNLVTSFPSLPPSVVAAKGNLLAVASVAPAGNAIVLYDVSDPAHLVARGATSSGSVYSMTMDDKRIYTGGPSAVSYYDVAPSGLRAAGTFGAHDDVLDLTVHDGRIFAAAGRHGGLRVYDAR